MTIDADAAIGTKPGDGKAIRTSDRDFSLELMELEMVLAAKAADNMDFTTAIKSALASTGNDYLFPFPPQNFPKDAGHVAAARICSVDGDCIAYVYERPGGGDERYQVVIERDLDPPLIEFADNYAHLLLQLHTVMTRPAKRAVH